MLKQILDKKEIEDKVQAVKEYINSIAQNKVDNENSKIVREAVIQLLDTSQENVEKVKAQLISQVQAENQKKLEAEL